MKRQRGEIGLRSSKHNTLVCPAAGVYFTRISHDTFDLVRFECHKVTQFMCRVTRLIRGNIREMLQIYVHGMKANGFFVAAMLVVISQNRGFSQGGCSLKDVIPSATSAWYFTTKLVNVI